MKRVAYRPKGVVYQAIHGAYPGKGVVDRAIAVVNRTKGVVDRKRSVVDREKSVVDRKIPVGNRSIADGFRRAGVDFRSRYVEYVTFSFLKLEIAGGFRSNPVASPPVSDGKGAEVIHNRWIYIRAARKRVGVRGKTVVD